MYFSTGEEERHRGPGRGLQINRSGNFALVEEYHRG
jgi:hypothetical protein